MNKLNLATLGALALLVGCELPIEIYNGDTVYKCACVVGDNNGGWAPEEYVGYVCADPINAQSTCSAMCSQHGGVLAQSAQLDEVCPPEPGGGSGGTGGEGEMAGGVPNSSEITLRRPESTATIRLGEQKETVHIGGSVKLTGGCESGACMISLNLLSLTTDNFSGVVDGDVLEVSGVHILNMGPMRGDQSQGRFEIASDQVSVLVNATVNGVRRGFVFTPADGQSVIGYYSASTATFALAGRFSSETARLDLDLVGTATSRPPIADAGPAQTVVGAPRAAVTLDGSRSRDLDGDLVDVLWFEGTTYLGHGVRLQTQLAVGTHAVTALAFDSTGKRGYAETTVAVVSP